MGHLTQCPECGLYQQDSTGECRRCNTWLGLSIDDSGTLEPEVLAPCDRCGNSMFDLGAGLATCSHCGNHINLMEEHDA